MAETLEREDTRSSLTALTDTPDATPRSHHAVFCKKDAGLLYKAPAEKTDVRGAPRRSFQEP